MNGNLKAVEYMARKHNLLVKAILLTVTSIWLFVGVVIPLYSKARLGQATLITKKKELQANADRVVFLTNLDSEVLDRRVAILNAALPTSKDVILYLKTIDGLSRELALSLKGVSLSPGTVGNSLEDKLAKSKEEFRSLDTELSITGSQDNIYSFLRAIEKTAPLMRVKDIRLSRDKNDFSLNLMLSMLYAPPNIETNLKGKVELFTTEEEAMIQQIGNLQSYVSDFNEPDLGTIAVGKNNLFEEIVEIEKEIPIASDSSEKSEN